MRHSTIWLALFASATVIAAAFIGVAGALAATKKSYDLWGGTPMIAAYAFGFSALLTLGAAVRGTAFPFVASERTEPSEPVEGVVGVERAVQEEHSRGPHGAKGVHLGFLLENTSEFSLRDCRVRLVLLEHETDPGVWTAPTWFRTFPLKWLEPGAREGAQDMVSGGTRFISLVHRNIFFPRAEIDLESRPYPDARSETTALQEGRWRARLSIEAFGFKPLTRTETFIWRIENETGELAWEEN